MKKKRIRVVAFALFRNRGRILAARGYDEVKKEHFYRPLGGGVEFGESAEEAVVREIREETGKKIRGVRLLGVVENRFRYNGKPHHEVAFLFDARFSDAGLSRRTGISYSDGDKAGTAEWVDWKDLRRRRIPLYPQGLLPLLRRIAR